VHYPLQSPAYKDELIVFLGALYFRLLGRNQHYGASARALAIDTAAPSGRNFPHSPISGWWRAAASRSRGHHLCATRRQERGRRVSFRIRPGAITQVEVHCQLYLRRAIGKLGRGPTHVMFLYARRAPRDGFDDYRPQVPRQRRLHDGNRSPEWIWRPLALPRELRVIAHGTNPRRLRSDSAGARFQSLPGLEAHINRARATGSSLSGLGKGGELVEFPAMRKSTTTWSLMGAGAAKPARASHGHSPIYCRYAHAETGRRAAGCRDRNGNPAGRPTRAFCPRRAPHAGGFRRRGLDGLEGRPTGQGAGERRQRQIEAVTCSALRAASGGSAFAVTPKMKKAVDLRCYLICMRGADGNRLSMDALRLVAFAAALACAPAPHAGFFGLTFLNGWLWRAHCC